MDMSLSLIFIKEQELQIISKATQTHVLIFFKKKFCLISGLKFTLPDVTSFLPDNLSELSKIIFRSEGVPQSLAEQTNADGI